MARLSTHVLDTARGMPARNLTIHLHRCVEGARQHIKSGVTNADGRTDEPLLSGGRIEIGVYELTFRAGDYFRSSGVELGNPPFLDDVVVRFGLNDPQGNYHVPLLVSPFGYSTYRGS